MATHTIKIPKELYYRACALAPVLQARSTIEGHKVGPVDALKHFIAKAMGDLEVRLGDGPQCPECGTTHRQLKLNMLKHLRCRGCGTTWDNPKWPEDA